VSGSDVFAGGNFTLATNSGGAVVPADYIAKWDGNAWSALGIGMNGQVSALAVSGTNLYAGGYFTLARNDAFSAVSANRIARWDGTRWWNETSPGIGSSEVKTLAVSGSNVFAGGNFTTAGGFGVHNIAQWNGSSWSAMGTGMNATVYAWAVSGSDVYAGGGFSTAGGGSANYIAKWNGSGWSPLGAGMSGPVTALAVSGSNLYAGGNFTLGILKWNGSAWSGLGLGLFGGTVYALAVAGDDVYVGGNFDTALNSPVSSIAVRNIAKWNGSNWSALGVGLNGRVAALAVLGGDVYVGGDFTTATNSGGGGVMVNHIAKWSGSTWSAVGLGVNAPVNSLTVSGSDVYAGGSFSRATNGGGASVLVNYVAKWNGSEWSALGSGFFNHVNAIAASGSDVYAGNGGGGGVYQWNGSVWSTLASSPGAIYSLAIGGSNLYVGGYFTMAGGKVSAYAAQAVLGDAPGHHQLTGSLLSGGAMRLSYVGYPSTNYAVDRTFNLSPPVVWTPQGTNTMSTSGVLIFTNAPNPTTNNFWRVRSVP
jgi:hypothetical protein